MCGHYLHPSDEVSTEDNVDTNRGLGGGGDTQINKGDGQGGEASQNLTVGGGHTIQVTPTFAAAHALREGNRLRSKRKLSLVLDLDHTLVHCVSHDEAGRWCGDERMKGTVRNFLLPFDYANLEKGISKGESLFFKLFGFSDPNLSRRHYLKLRPNLREFLTALHSKYELTIYTAGTRYYALKVAHAICRYMVGADDVDVFTEEGLGGKEMEAVKLNQEIFGKR